MPASTDISFTSGELRRGGQMSSATADAAGGVAGQIAAIAINGAAFGGLPAAASLGTTLSAFRDDHVELGQQVQAVHVSLAGRAAGVAGEGDGMVRDTSAEAGAVRSSVPGIAQ